MRKIWLLWGIITLVWACDTEQKVIDTGVSNPYFDEDTKKELTAIENDENEIKERFYADLAFGTAVSFWGTSLSLLQPNMRMSKVIMKYLLFVILYIFFYDRCCHRIA
ncbi:hypothetical protein [uncultured Parabacteroides sp.]|uniref:hypothetical protein n=1 Tax=uncultured Parabacteroides sp. TaxID=512312 RepID=UPI0025E32D11|nr:hypothetical protein [uncultured Parabacteroides sp.]